VTPTPLYANFHRRRLNTEEANQLRACREGCVEYPGESTISFESESFDVHHEGTKVCVSNGREFDASVPVECSVQPGSVQVKLETQTENGHAAGTTGLIMVAFMVAGEWTPLEQMDVGGLGELASSWYSLSGAPTQVKLSSIEPDQGMSNEDGWAFDWLKVNDVVVASRDGASRCPDWGIDDYPTGSFSGCGNQRVFDIPA